VPLVPAKKLLASNEVTESVEVGLQRPDENDTDRNRIGTDLSFSPKKTFRERDNGWRKVLIFDGNVRR
jgi:hypothetical protein